MSRRRWVYTTDGGVPLPEPIEVSDNWANTAGPSRRSEAEIYGKLVTGDGQDVSSRRRYREYCQAAGVTHYSDFKGEWAQAEKRRAALASGELTRRDCADAVGRAMYQAGQQNRSGRR